jgi:cytochrome bd ubiquinol oxidase subunit II
MVGFLGKPASGDYALKVVTVVAAVMFPVVLLYQGWSYWVFRARINTPTETIGPASGAPHTTSR